MSDISSDCKENIRTVRVTASATLYAAPDVIDLRLELGSLRKEYEEVLDIAAEEHEEVKKVFEANGLDRSSLKTVSFRVFSEYDTVEEKKWKEKKYSKELSGFRYEHKLRVELPLDVKLLGSLVKALAESGANPRTDITYTVKDAEAVKNELLRKLAEDARTKASIIAKATGSGLGKLLSADVSLDDDMDLNIRYGDCGDCAMGAPVPVERSLEFTPDDISVSDSMTFIWELV